MPLTDKELICCIINTRSINDSVYMHAPEVLPWQCCIVTVPKRKDLQGEI